MLLSSFGTLLISTAVGHTFAQSAPKELYDQTVARKARDLANSGSQPSQWPQYTFSNGNGSYELFSANTWTSSFFPAQLYLLNLRKQLCPNSDDPILTDTDWVELGRSWSAGLAVNKDLTNTHDVGFLSYAFQEELVNDQGNNETAKGLILDMAKNLANRFNPKVGCTKSWDQGGPDDFEVIIDNMQNLELLMLASVLTSNQSLVDIATSHANKTIQNHLRPDASSFHVVDYSDSTGEVLWQGTAQGYSNSSTWSRGQAWGIYGFANMYNWTGIETYLDTARRMGNWYISHLPDDGVPYWDFDAPLDTNPIPTKDTSSAMIAASGMLQLSSIEMALKNSSGAEYWQSSATKLISDTVNLSWGASRDWESLLANGTVNNRANPRNNNTGIIYGDYYFVEAGNRLLQLGLTKCTDGSSAIGASPDNDLSGLGDLNNNSESGGTSDSSSSSSGDVRARRVMNGLY